MAARLTKLPPKLTAVKSKRQHWGIRLNNFRVKYDLSERDLAAVIDYTLQKSSIHKLCSGIVNPRMGSVIKPTIASKLRQFLREKKKQSAIEAERELLEIFHEPICTEKEKEPVLTQRAVLPRAAQNFFGLRHDPFTSDPRARSEVFTTPAIDKIANQLEDAINYQHFVSVIGEIGAGKSLLKRRIMDSCEKSKGKMRLFWPEFMNMEKVHSGSIASFLLRKFGQSAPRDLVMRADRLKETLATMSNEGIRTAIGFDECHRLDPRLLTALKNFWELGSGGFDRYLGLVLFGQPKFQMTLQNPEFREITERLDVIHLPNLGRHAWDYVVHRIKVAGGSAEKLFEREAVIRLAEVGATPLALGNLANAALIEAHSKNEKKVTRGLIKLVLGPENGEPRVRAVSGRSAS